jgi:hypothetical protein
MRHSSLDSAWKTEQDDIFHYFQKISLTIDNTLKNNPLPYTQEIANCAKIGLNYLEIWCFIYNGI